jgi:hypothetical protein
MQLSRKAIPYLSVIHGLMRHFGRHYVFPSQGKIIELLSRYVSMNISRRMLNYDLRRIENSGLIRRVRRHRRTARHGMEFRSTLYEISFLGYHLMARLGMITWGVYRSMVSAVKEKSRIKCVREEKSVVLGGLSTLGNVLGGLSVLN